MMCFGLLHLWLLIWWLVFCLQLFCMFETMEEKFGIMSNLRHRVLPPQMLLKWPKISSFCLWLLHPEPSSRPKMRFFL